jgi:hypothetical protein
LPELTILAAKLQKNKKTIAKTRAKSALLLVVFYAQAASLY